MYDGKHDDILNTDRISWLYVHVLRNGQEIYEHGHYFTVQTPKLNALKAELWS